MHNDPQSAIPTLTGDSPKCCRNNSSVSQNAFSRSLRSFLPRIPRIEELGIRPGYSGLYDMSPDDNPIIDAVPGVDGLFAICGSSGHGFKMGAAVGEAAAQMALGENPDVLAPFAIGRFL